jgi:uncharacterized membrane protein
MKMDIQQNRGGALQNARWLSLAGLLLIGIIGFVLIFRCTGNYGVGLSGDSVGYITWARNLAENYSFSKADGSSLVIWPPLYPTLLAFFKFFGADEFFAARLISTISFGLIIFLSGLWILRYCGSLTFAIIGAICMLLSRPVFGVCCWAWSEPIFILLTIIFLLLLPGVIDKPTFKSTLLLAIVTSALVLTRYIGIVFFPIGAIVLFCGIKGGREKLIFTIFWGAVSAFLPGIWIIRNLILTGTATGIRPAAFITFNENVQLAGDALKSWFMPVNIGDLVPAQVFFVLFCIFISAIFVFIAYKIIKRGEFDWPFIAVSLFALFYLTLIIYSVTTVSMDRIDDRLLSPVYPATVFIIAAIMSKLLRAGSSKYFVWKKLCYGLIAGIGLCIWFIAGLNHTSAISKRVSESGMGFASSFWKNSETIAWLKTNRPKGRIYSNDPHSIYILTNINAEMVPTKVGYFKNLDPKDQKESEEQIPKFKSILENEENVYLVWFLNHFRQYLYEPNQLQEFCGMKLIKKCRDGYIIALYPKPDAGN